MKRLVTALSLLLTLLASSPAPQVLEFDAAGKYIQGWNLTGEGYEPLQQCASQHRHGLAG